MVLGIFGEYDYLIGDNRCDFIIVNKIGDFIIV